MADATAPADTGKVRLKLGTGAVLATTALLVSRERAALGPVTEVLTKATARVSAATAAAEAISRSRWVETAIELATGAVLAAADLPVRRDSEAIWFATALMA